MEHVFQLATFIILILFSFFVFVKLLNVSHKITYRIVVAEVVFSCVLGCVIFLLSEVMPLLRFALMLFLIVVFAGKATGVKWGLALTATLLAFGISFGVLFTVVVISAVLLYPIVGHGSIGLLTILASIVSGAALFYFFKIKRFRKGFPFLHNKWSGIVGVIISGILICSLVLINRGLSPQTGYALLAVVVACIAGIIFWCRKEIFKLYIARIRNRDRLEIEADNAVMYERILYENKILRGLKVGLEPLSYVGAQIVLEKIEQMLREREELDKMQPDAKNKAMAYMIHRDAKLIPALQEAIGTKNPLIDGILKEMTLKAEQNKIEMKVDCDLSSIDEAAISFLDFETVVADLLENAIIATAPCKCRQIQISIGKDEDGFFAITVLDSGVPFKAETLETLGKKPASTRLGEGGSGIGYMTIFSIMETYKASLVICRLESGFDGFTKSVSFRLDGVGDYRAVYTSLH